MIGLDDVVEGGLVVILPSFLEGSEIMFDRVQVWRIRGEKQQGRARRRDELRRVGRGMKCGAVHDHEVLGIQPWAQPRLQPGVENRRITGAFEQTGLCQSPIDASGNERDAWPSMPGNQAIDALAFGRVPIPPHRRRGNPAFIDVDGLFAAAQEPFAQTEEPFSSERVAFSVAQPFFYE